MGRLDVGILGSLEVSCDGRKVEVGGLKRRAIMAMIALRPGEVVTDVDLIDGIWGDNAPANVRNSMQANVSHWRKAISGPSSGEVITRRGAGYSLMVGREAVDLSRFEDVVASARQASLEGKWLAAVRLFDEAARLWRGEALAEFAELPFHLWEAPRLMAVRTEFLVSHIDAMLRLGAGTQLVGQLENLVALHPYEERFIAQLMHALYRAGRQVDAVNAAEAARQTLAEIGLRPGAAIRVMEARVLRQDPDLEDWSWPFSVTPLPGTHATLVGRSADLESLLHCLMHSSDRLVTVTGPGGVGKTRLSIDAARRYLDEGLSPVAYVAVNELRDASLLSSALHMALGTPESWNERSVADLARVIGRTPMLIVLDGAEHLLASIRSVVSDLLANGPEIRVLVTSRTSLGVGGEHEVRLQPLRTVPLGEAFEDLRTLPAVELFIDRYMRLSGSPIADSEITSVAEICRKLDGLPLAIELAVARTPTLGVEGLRDRLGSCLDLLADPARGRDERHSSLRAVMEWSHGLLTRSAQALLPKLAIFAGGICIYHLEEMWPEVTPFEHAQSLDELLRNSLLVRMSNVGLPRFRLLDTVREFSYERLVEHDEVADVNRRLAAWILRRLESAPGRTGAGAIQFEELEAEVDNVRAAMSGLLESGDGDASLRFANGLYVWWMYMVRRSEEANWLESGLRLPAESKVERARALLNLGRIRAQDSDNEVSSSHLESAAALFSEIGDANGLCETLVSLAENTALVGQGKQSAVLLSRASALALEAGDPVLEARVAVASAILSIMTEDYRAAVETCSRTLDLPIAHAWADLRIKTLSQLAEAARGLGEMATSLDALERAIDLAQVTRNNEAYEFALAQHALTLYAAGRFEEAAAAAYKCLGATSGVDPDPRSMLASAAVLISVPSGVDGALRVRARDLFSAIGALYPHVRLAERDLRVLAADLGAFEVVSADTTAFSRSSLLRLLRGLLEGMNVDGAELGGRPHGGSALDLGRGALGP